MQRVLFVPNLVIDFLSLCKTYTIFIMNSSIMFLKVHNQLTLTQIWWHSDELCWTFLYIEVKGTEIKFQGQMLGLQNRSYMNGIRYCWFKSDLERRTLHLIFNLTGVRTHDLQIMDNAFYFPETLVRTLSLSLLSSSQSQYAPFIPAMSSRPTSHSLLSTVILLPHSV